MKKWLLLLLATALIYVQCGREHTHYDAVWYVKNSTSQTISILPPPYGEFYSSITLASGEGVQFLRHRKYDDKPYFGMILKFWQGWTEENISLEVVSSNGAPLMTWKMSDANLSGKQFFNESSWRYSMSKENEEAISDWFFEITSDDIKQ